MGAERRGCSDLFFKRMDKRKRGVACVLAAVFSYAGGSIPSKRKVPLSAWLCLAAQAAGTSVMILAPGNFARVGRRLRFDAVEIIKRLIRITLYIRCVRVAPPAGAAANLRNVGGRLSADARQKGRMAVAGGTAERVCNGRLSERSDRPYTCVDCAGSCRAGDACRRYRCACARAGCGETLRAAAGAVSIDIRRLSGCQDVSAHEAAWNAQTPKSSRRRPRRGERENRVGGKSRSRFTMSIQVELDAEKWPNSTLSKWFGGCIWRMKCVLCEIEQKRRTFEPVGITYIATSR